MTSLATLESAVRDIRVGNLERALDDLCELWGTFRPEPLGGILNDLGEIYGKTVELEGYAGYLKARDLVSSPRGSERSIGYHFALSHPDRALALIKEMAAHPVPDPRPGWMFLAWHGDPPDRNRIPRSSGLSISGIRPVISSA